MMLVGLVGVTLPSVSLAQAPQAAPSPLPAGNPPVVIHYGVPDPPVVVAPYPVRPAEGFVTTPYYPAEAPAPQERFHLLPKAFRDRVLQCVGRAPSETIQQPSSIPLPAPEVVGPPVTGVPQMLPAGPVPDLPGVADPSLPMRDPSMAWRMKPISSPSDLSPNAPPYPAQCHILPQGIRQCFIRCWNKCGLGCYADRDTPGCGSCRQEFWFVFGSCRYFFGEGCFPEY
jgi:hypothetical protein